MSALRTRHIDRLLRSLFACVLFLTVLCLWRLSYEGSCAALVLPALIWCAIFYGCGSSSSAAQGASASGTARAT